MSKQRVAHAASDVWLQSRAYSPAVVVTGGKTVYLAGHVGPTSDDGTKLTGDFEGQVRQTFKNLETTLKQVGGSLGDLVTMTVWVLDMKHGDRFVELRREILRKDFPCSALIGASSFAAPDILVEIQAIAVID